MRRDRRRGFRSGRSRRRGAAPLAAVEERELSEGRTGAENREGGDVAERRADADRDVPPFDQVHRLAAVAFVEDHFAG